MINIFVGFDQREAIAYHTFCQSVIDHASQPLRFTPLALNTLAGYSEIHADGSNQFVYSRFLVPFLMDYRGWALFADGDMIVRDDIAKLWSLRDDTKAVMVVKHDYKTKARDKYLGNKNQDYPRKNWSSVVLWNCGHESNRRVDPAWIEAATGAQLHRFSWLADELIGELPKVWNWLPDELGPNEAAKLLHWTLGTPCFHEYADAPMASEWHQARMLANYSLQKT